MEDQYQGAMRRCRRKNRLTSVSGNDSKEEQDEKSGLAKQKK